MKSFKVSYSYTCFKYTQIFFSFILSRTARERGPWSSGNDSYIYTDDYTFKSYL
ncbi:hypothetical protein Mapa_015439 [Marchantia paleacea]|nr:hypothetical protein Mapa_015439 [Marchantia paleacea]